MSIALYDTEHVKSGPEAAGVIDFALGRCESLVIGIYD
jgi:hypothetical protein